MRKSLAVIALVPVAALAACSSSGVTSSSTAPAAPAASDSAPASEAPAPETGAKPFGTTVTYDDGLALTVAQPAAFKPSATSAGAKKGGTSFKQKITVKNGTDELYSSVMLSLNYSSAEPCDQIFDSAGDVNGITGDIGVGKTVTYTVAYSCTGAKGDALTLIATPDMISNDKTEFEGKLP